MNVIKARAWDGERMIYDTDGLTVGEIIDRYETVMLWTGVNDTVTGAEIYESDILRTSWGDREVKWGKYSAAWMVDAVKELGFIAGERRVLGNVYEGMRDE